MDIKFNIFISHDANDQSIALELKSFLEKIFLNLNVYVSGRDLVGGQTWIEHIKLTLKSSQLIIALISKKSINANWLYFESGAGFTDDRTIPLITDNLNFEDLNPPLSLLQGRILDKVGIPFLLSDVAKKLNLRQPSSLPGLDEMILTIDNFIADRDKNIATQTSAVVQPQKIVINTPKQIDQKVLLAYNLLNQRAKKALMQKLLSISDKYDIPNQGELQKMSVDQLCGVANAYNIPIPTIANLRLLSAALGMPSETDDEWKKLNFLNGFDQANLELDRYEKTS